MSVVLLLTQLAAIARVFFISPRPYRWFIVTVAISVAQLCASLLLDASSSLYLRFWLISAPLLLMGIVAAGLEIIARIPDQFGIPRLAFDRRMLLTAFQLALLLALISAAVEACAGELPNRSVWLPRELTALRITTFLVALLLVFVARLVHLIPVPFQPNLIIHARLFCAWVLLNSGSTLAAHFIWNNGTVWWTLNTAMAVVSALLFVGWTLLLSPAGEKYPERPPVSPEEVRTLKTRTQELINVLRRAASR